MQGKHKNTWKHLTRTLSVQTLPKSDQRIQNVVFNQSQILSWSCPVLSWSPGHQVTRSSSINSRSVLKSEIWGGLPFFEDDGRWLSLPWASPDLPWSFLAVSWPWEASKLDFPGLPQNSCSGGRGGCTCGSSCDFIIYRAARWAAKNERKHLRNSCKCVGIVAP